jgi:uncharacterized membrane protein YdjX (TVP38/TMEM64 family)
MGAYPGPGASGEPIMNPEGTADAKAEVEASVRRSFRKLVVLALVLGLAVTVLHVTPLRALVSDVQTWKAKLNAVGPVAPLLFLFLGTGLVALGVPRLALCGLAGALFGFLLGSGIAYLSALGGGYLTFLFVRWGGREWVRRRLALSPRVRDLLSHPNWGSVVLFRQLPVVGLVQNAALALTELSHREFLGGTAIGILPSTLLVALIGSGAGKASLKASLTALSLSMILLGLLALGGIRWRNARAKNAPGWNARTAR